MSCKRKRPSSVSPDSTTQEECRSAGVSLGQQVFSHCTDGNFYLGTVTELDECGGRCLVRLADGSRHWSAWRHVRPLPDRSLLTCARCHSRTGPSQTTTTTASSDDMVRCLLCRRSFHVTCALHDESAGGGGLSVGWTCVSCRETPRCHSADHTTAVAVAAAVAPSTLSYRPDELVWCSGHKVNRSLTYCYCGGPGRWFDGMLQCVRCHQWYHEACVRCLQCRLVPGDRFYVFLCGVCSHADGDAGGDGGGGEILRRVPLGWPQLVHLALFALTLRRRRRYHELDDDIVPWLDQHWRQLALPPALRVTPRGVRRTRVLRTLTDHRHKSRFLCGRENKKRPGLWCLRVQSPPSPPVVKLPSLQYRHLRLLADFDVECAAVSAGAAGGGGVDVQAARDKTCVSLSAAAARRLAGSKRRVGASLTKSRSTVRTRRCVGGGGGAGLSASSSTNGVAAAAAKARPGRQLRARLSLPAPGSADRMTNDAVCGDDAVCMEWSGGETPVVRCVGPARSLLALIPAALDGGNPFSSSDQPTVVTRQLCEKDIRIGKNGEVRRRRRRTVAAVTAKHRRRPPDAWRKLNIASNTAVGGHVSLGVVGTTGRPACSVLARRVTREGVVQYLFQWPS